MATLAELARRFPGAGVPTNRGIGRPSTGGLDPNPGNVRYPPVYEGLPGSGPGVMWGPPVPPVSERLPAGMFGPHAQSQQGLPAPGDSNPGNVRYPPVPAGIPAGMWGQAQDRLMAQAQPQVGSQEWLQSPQGLSAFGDVTSRARMGNPTFAGAAGMMRGRMGGEGAAAAARGTAYQQAEAAKQNAPASSYAGPPAYMGGGFTYDPMAGVQGPAGYKGAPWYDPNRTGQTLAQYIQGLPPEERDAMLAKYRAAGMASPLGGGGGSPGNPFGV